MIIFVLSYCRRVVTDMIRGIGVDLCSIERMKTALEKKGFAERVFSAEEIVYAESTSCPEEHFAAAFAAREALAKALKIGLAGLERGSVYVRRTENGPVFVFDKQLLAADERSFLSISHEDGLAAAFVVIEGD